MRLFLDANILFTAAYSPDGRSHALLLLAERSLCSLLCSAYAIDEARRNIRLKAPARSDALDDLLAVVKPVPEADRRVLAWAAGHGLPDTDAPILAAAVAARADLLVTGDRRHFGHLFGSRPGGTLVLPPADALAAVLDDSGL